MRRQDFMDKGIPSKRDPDSKNSKYEDDEASIADKKSHPSVITPRRTGPLREEELEAGARFRHKINGIEVILDVQTDNLRGWEVRQRRMGALRMHEMGNATLTTQFLINFYERL